MTIMKSKSTLLIVLAAGLLMGADTAKDAGAAKEVAQAIQTLNDAFLKANPDQIRRLMTDEHVSITPYYGGPMSKSEQLKNLPELKMSEYTSGEIKVTFVSKDVALVTYPLAQKGYFKGKVLAPKNYSAAVWVNRDGRWLEASYQETALAESK